ncbi:MAG TPA: hypothetical protein VHK25_07050 [Acidimicrobiales bacterium]|nr:hypothetical protein [Acidimicrobiales bacterium]
MTRVLAIEGGPHGIRVNAIAPMARTRMTDGLLGDMHDWLDPELVAPVAAWLAASAARSPARYSRSGEGGSAGSSWA